MSLFWEDQTVGRIRELGAHPFTREEILSFARRFDPQPFHVDEEAAKASIFGGLVASGLHTGGVFMRKLVAYIMAETAAGRARGETPPKLGVSPGFRDMRWPVPVRPGDVVTYRSEVVGSRETKRPGWGLTTIENRGLNQRGETAVIFVSSAFFARRDG